MSIDDYSGEPFSSRAVSEDVARERGYTRYELGDVETPAAFGLSQEWLRAGKVDAPGWVIPKYTTVAGHELRAFGTHPSAQLRPDWPLLPRAIRHDHARRTRLDVPHRAWSPSRGWYMEEWRHPLRGLARIEHERKLCDWVRLPARAVRRLPVDVIDSRRRGRATEYLVPTGHLDPDTGEIRVPLDGVHVHLDWAKYLYALGRGSKRFGTHPRMIADDFATPEGLMFWAIEGTLKLDAIVSAGWPGIETGSVTLWDSQSPRLDYDGAGDDGYEHELSVIAQTWLRGTPTVIVCDSDWATNAAVRRQVDAAVELLASLDVPAIGAAPPPGARRAWLEANGLGPRRKLGVDDYLAAFPEDARHDALLAMPVREVVPTDEVERASWNASGNARGAATSRRVIEWAQSGADDSGLFEWHESEAAERLGLARSNASTALDRLASSGYVERITEAHRYATEQGARMVAPVYVLASELRPVPGRSISEWLANLK